MVYDYGPLLLVISLNILKHAETKSVPRNKRVLYGIEGFRQHRDTYPSFRYYVFLAKGPLLDNVDDEDSLSKWIGLNGPIPNNLECGGVLLTPSIVQTACHCLSNFYMSGKPGSNVSKAYPMDVWEDRIYSYLGSNLVTEMQSRLRPKYYMIYARCKKVEGIAQIGLYDYGLIISDDSVDRKNPGAEISYAPVYRGNDVLKFYYEALEKEFMCLLIGHGPYQTDANLLVDPEASLEIRWGWRTVMKYHDCFAVSYSVEARNEYTFDYKRDATWVCAQAFSSRNSEYYVNTEGDSGGPMTCNDVYFSVFSMTTEIDNDDVISYSGPLVHTNFENTAEYRDELIRYVRGFASDGRPIPGYPDFVPTPPPDDDLFHVVRSSTTNQGPNQHGAMLGRPSHLANTSIGKGQLQVQSCGACTGVPCRNGLTE